MSYYGDKDFWLEVEKGNVSGHSIVHKFGHNGAVDTAFAPVSDGAVYQTPQVAGATTLRVKAGGDANDDAAGSGAQKVLIQGLSATGALQSEALVTAGAAASAVSVLTYIRLFRSYVSESGTYATAVTGSHAADITIENGAGGTDWATLNASGFPRAQTNIALYSVPLGFTAYVANVVKNVDTSKTTEVLLFKREDILQTAAPYSAKRLVREYDGLDGPLTVYAAPIRFPALTDFGFVSKVNVGTAAVSIHFDIMLVED